MYLARDAAVAWFYWRAGYLTLGEWLRSYAGPKRLALWDPLDPLPSLALPLGYLARRFRRERGRAASPAREVKELSWAEQVEVLRLPRQP